jgi:hypothetical protein
MSFEEFERKEHEFLLYLTARFLPTLIRTQIEILRDLINFDPRLSILAAYIGRLQELERDLDRRIGFIRSEVEKIIRARFGYE